MAKIIDKGGYLELEGSTINATRFYMSQGASFSGWVVRKGFETTDPISSKARAIEIMQGMVCRR